MISVCTDKIIGLEISSGGVGGVLLRRDKGAPVLEQISFQALAPDVLCLSRKEPHLLNPAAFVQQLKSLRSSLQTTVSRVALSLPDTTGRIILLDVDETWKNREEATEQILWKLKKSLPHETLDLHLDFQVLLKREGGPSLVLVALVARQIVAQYENLLDESGFEAAWIDLNQVNLIRAYSGEIGYGGTSAFVSWYGDSLGVVMIHEGVPVFWRSKYLPVERGDGERIDQELHGSLAAYRKQYPEPQEIKVFFFSPCDRDHIQYDLVSSLWEKPPVVLGLGSICRPAPGVSARTVLPDTMIAGIAAAAGHL